MKQVAVVQLAPLRGPHRIPRPRTFVWAGIAAAAALAVYVALPKGVVRRPAEEQPVTRERILISSALSLSAARTDRGVEITWNAAATPVTSARVGVLSVKDGGSSREIPLTQAQLQAGKLPYQAESDRLEVALEVFSGSGEKVRESMLVAVAPQSHQAVVTTPLTEAAAATSVANHRTESAQQRTRHFIPPVQTARRAPSASLVLTDAPALQLAATAPAAPALPAVSLPPPPARVTGPAQAARPLRQVKPTVPSNVAALVRAPVAVRIRVHIDAQGQVTQAEALNASSSGVSGYLTQSALAAAKLWSFAPARQGSTAVPSEMVLSFAFGAGQ